MVYVVSLHVQLGLLAATLLAVVQAYPPSANIAPYHYLLGQGHPNAYYGYQRPFMQRRSSWQQSPEALKDYLRAEDDEEAFIRPLRAPYALQRRSLGESSLMSDPSAKRVVTRNDATAGESGPSNSRNKQLLMRIFKRNNDNSAPQILAPDSYPAESFAAEDMERLRRAPYLIH